MAASVDIQKETPEIKEVELDILEVEENAYIVKVDGWRMRVYFDKDYSKQPSRMVKVKYTGDITDAHTVKFERLV